MFQTHDEWFQPYREWITANVQGDGLGQCASVTQLMILSFPELIRVRGHYMDPCWGPREHWWCKTSDGEIVDPTAAQFPSVGASEYIEFEDGSEEPIGKCLECGEYCWESEGGNSNFCSPGHERSYLAYLNSGVL